MPERGGKLQGGDGGNWPTTDKEMFKIVRRWELIRAELEPQKDHGGDYWREANNLSSVCERASGTELGVIFVYLCKLKEQAPEWQAVVSASLLPSKLRMLMFKHYFFYFR